MKGMKPYRITNIALAYLVLWRIVDGIELTGDNFLVFLIGVGLYCIGMIPIAEYFTGQKTITTFSHNRIIKVNRNDHFSLMLQLLFLLPTLFCGVAAMMIL